MPNLGCGRGVVVGEHLGHRGKLAGMHVGRAATGAAQRRRLERTLEFLSFGLHEGKLQALVGCGVAVWPQAVERVGLDLGDGFDPPGIGSRGGEADIVELVVGQPRAIVAIDALALADEELEPGPLLFGQGAAGLAAGDGVGIVVKARPSGQQGTLEGGDGLAGIGEGAVWTGCDWGRAWNTA